MSARDKINPSPTSIEPKKSVRLAEKRKLREESGPSNASEDYFTTFPISKSSAANRLKTASPIQINTSSRSASPSPSKEKKAKKSDSPELLTTTSAFSVSPSTPLSSKALAFTPTKSPRGSSPSFSNVNLNSSLNRSSGIISSSTTATTIPHSISPSAFSSLIDDKKKNQKSSSSAIEEVLEEEKWLDALEAGNLEELEDVELRQMKNPKLMTARQRAMLGKKDKDVFGFSVDDEMCSLFNKKEKLAVTQEMIKLKAEKTEKRRQLAHEKKEKDKKKTMDRLLKKQDSKALKTTFKPKTMKKPTDYKITFISKPDVNIISFPVSYPLPFEKRDPPLVPPKVVLCAVNGCQNRKKYSCSRTKMPHCSLECYKKNLDNHFRLEL